MILAGDIGGTKTLLALADTEGGQLHIRNERRCNSTQYEHFAEILQEFFDINAVDTGTVKAACFGIPGPVEDNKGRTTNLPWEVDGDQLREQFGIPQVTILNDFACIAHALANLQDNQLVEIQAGQAIQGATKVILGPGTGLGMAYLFWDGDGYRVQGTEGGHGHFAATDEQQAQLMLFLKKSLGGRVSNERLLSGPGLENIFHFLYQQAEEDQRQTVTGLLKSKLDLAQGISNMAKGGNALTNACLDLFARIFAQVAGDLALTHMARGGVYLAGGITPKILARLGTDSFVQRFNDKGRMTGLMEKMPLLAIQEPRAGLLGALHYCKD